MSTNHAAEARRGLKAFRKNLEHVIPASEKRGGFTNDERIRLAQAGATVAQVNATLALVEAQQEANDIAQKDAERERVTTLLDIVSFGTDELVAAVRPHVFWSNDEQGESLRPEIAAALGITNDKEANDG